MINSPKVLVAGAAAIAAIVAAMVLSPVSFSQVTPPNQVEINGCYGGPPVSLSNGQSGCIEVDAAGRLIAVVSGVSISATLTPNSQIYVQNASGTWTAVGYNATASSVPVNVVAGGTGGGTVTQGTSPWSVTQSGIVTVQPNGTVAFTVLPTSASYLNSQHVTLDTTPVNVSVANLPAVQTVSGTVQVGNAATLVCTSKAPINQTGSTDVISGTSGQHIFLCGVVLTTAAPQSISVVEGTGTSCASSILGVIGGTVASMQFVTSSGFSSVGGIPWIQTSQTGVDICVLQTGAATVSGVITYGKQ